MYEMDPYESPDEQVVAAAEEAKTTPPVKLENDANTGTTTPDVSPKATEHEEKAEEEIAKEETIALTAEKGAVLSKQVEIGLLKNNLKMQTEYNTEIAKISNEAIRNKVIDFITNKEIKKLQQYIFNQNPGFYMNSRNGTDRDGSLGKGVLDGIKRIQNNTSENTAIVTPNKAHVSPRFRAKEGTTDNKLPVNSIVKQKKSKEQSNSKSNGGQENKDALGNEVKKINDIGELPKDGRKEKIVYTTDKDGLTYNFYGNQKMNIVDKDSRMFDWSDWIKLEKTTGKLVWYENKTEAKPVYDTLKKSLATKVTMDSLKQNINITPANNLINKISKLDFNKDEKNPNYIISIRWTKPDGTNPTYDLNFNVTEFIKLGKGGPEISLNKFYYYLGQKLNTFHKNKLKEEKDKAIDQNLNDATDTIESTTFTKEEIFGNRELTATEQTFLDGFSGNKIKFSKAELNEGKTHFHVYLDTDADNYNSMLVAKMKDFTDISNNNKFDAAKFKKQIKDWINNTIIPKKAGISKSPDTADVI